MDFLGIILIILLILSLTINYLNLISKKSAIETINNMGIGYNLGYSFDCFKEENETIIDIDELITSKGNPIPTKKLIKSLKKNGFKTIRFPITWQNFINQEYKINPEWMTRVKTVVDLIINENLYCIINLYNDGIDGNWLQQGIKVRDKFICLWKQIAEEFRDYDEFLIFESLNELSIYNWDYENDTLFNLTQAFIDIIRNSGGKNEERLLVITGPIYNIDYILSSEYKLPIDPSNKIAINIKYFFPSEFTLSEDFNFSFVDENGLEYTYTSLKKWGSDADYYHLVTNFQKMKSNFIDKGIAVILGEVGVFTEENKEIESIREYIYSVFAFASNYNGIMACLWDTSNKSLGDMNYYNREKNEWYDKKLGDIFKKISKGNYIKPYEYIINTNNLTYDIFNNQDYLFITIGSNKLITIIINVVSKNYYPNYFFIFKSVDKNEHEVLFEVGDKYRKREYDGSFTYTIDVKNKDLIDFIQIENLISYNYITFTFQDYFISIDKKAYKQEISQFNIYQ